ncbi:hypothetical protein AWB94_05705 [Mycolicibacterium canariasense]|nr:hypothetical protein AWB94_05705 [Mycolicibacterium canariasense]
MAHDDTVAAAIVASPCTDAEAARQADQCQGRFGAWAVHSEPLALTGQRQVASGENCTTPSSFDLVAGTTDDPRWHPRGGSAAVVDQPGLSGEVLGMGHAQQVVVAVALAVSHGVQGWYGAAQVIDGADQALCGGEVIEFGVDNDLVADDCEPTGEPEHRRDLSLTGMRRSYRHGAELVFNQVRRSR